MENKRYNHYYQTNLPWVKEIPEGWQVIPFKRLFSSQKGLPITKADLVEEGVPVISYGQIHSKSNNGITVKDELLRFVPNSFLETNPSSLVKKGDFIFADTSEDIEGCGNCVFIDVDYALFAGYHSIIARNNSPYPGRYFAYLFQTDEWRTQIRSKVNGVKLYSITQPILFESKVIVPPADIQESIANSLDKKIADIESIIEKRAEELALLQEYRLSIITEAVTRGLNPKATFTESGIDWMGEIPSNWSIYKIGWLFEQIGSGTTPSTDESSYYSDGGGIPWLQTGDLNDSLIYYTTKHITELALKNCHLTVYPKGSIVVAMYGATIGKLGMLEIECCTNQACCVLSGSKLLYNRFGYYALLASKQSLINKSVGGGQPNISQGIIRNHKLPVPPIAEQHEIVLYLDGVVGKIENLVSSIEQEMARLREFKKSTISEAVLGKLEMIK